MSQSQPRLLVDRAERALADHAADPAALWDPLLPAALRYLDEAKGGRRDRAPLLRRWQGNPRQQTGRRRYRWPIVWDDDPENPLKWARRPGQERVLWRPLEEPALRRDPAAFASRLTLPLILFEALDFLEETTRSEPSLEAEARSLLVEAIPHIEHDVSHHVIGDDAWGDTFALWQLARHPLALERLDPLAIAAATRFASGAEIEGGRVLGSDFPFFEVQLDSASAHLAAALWTLGTGATLLPPLVGFLRERQRPDGGWGDAGQQSDILTTLAVADLLAHLDPGFTLEPNAAATEPFAGSEAAGRVVAFLARRQEAAGWWRAFDPETPWLTAEICRWLRVIERPFHSRFRWPHLSRWQRDRKTQLPLFGFFEDLARAAAGLGALGEARLEAAFIDLIGFGAWNKEYGQQRGDELLAVLAAALRDVPETLVVRDGGDEFVVIGKPNLLGALQPRLEAFRRTWPDRCRAALPDVPPVAARIVLGNGCMREALPIRELLGRAVGETAAAWEPAAPFEGVMTVAQDGRLTLLHGRPR